MPVLELDKASMPCVIDTFIVFYLSADLKNREQQQNSTYVDTHLELNQNVKATMLCKIAETLVKIIFH